MNEIPSSPTRIFEMVQFHVDAQHQSVQRLELRGCSESAFLQPRMFLLNSIVFPVLMAPALELGSSKESPFLPEGIVTAAP